MPFKVQKFKQAMSNFATGVTIVTTRNKDKVHGMTANAFCSVSLDPSLVLVCVAKHLYSHKMIENSEVFAVNLLSMKQRPLAERFAGMIPGLTDRFAGLTYDVAVTGSPILAESLAWVDCRTWATYDGGDHTIFVGQVIESNISSEHPPLLYYQRHWSQLGKEEKLTNNS